MKILYFYQYFSTPNGSWGTRVYEFAKEWVKEGAEVTVITSIYNKSDLKVNRFIEKQYFDNIEVIIINIEINNKNKFIYRVYTFLLYSIVASFYALTIKCDYVISSSGPITVAIPGLIAKFLRNRKLVFEVRDLWPQGAIELGLLRNKILQKAAFFIEKLTYLSSNLIVCLSPGIVQNIDNRFGLGHKCISIPNSVNIDLFSNLISNESQYSFDYAIYTGNIGEVNNTNWLLNAAREIDARGINDLKIIIIGDGHLKNSIKAAISNELIESLILLDLIPKVELITIIQHAFVSLVPLKGSPILDTSSPNKFFESLGAGVPVIQNTNGWMKEFLNKNRVGETINPNDYNELVNVMLNYRSIKGESRKKMSSKCKEVAKQFDKTLLSKSMLDAIKEL